MPPGTPQAGRSGSHHRRRRFGRVILRDQGGSFADFGDRGPLLFGESVGRFSGLMPRNKPSLCEAAKARAVLLGLGMSIINRGFDPTMN